MRVNDVLMGKFFITNAQSLAYVWIINKILSKRNKNCSKCIFTVMPKFKAYEKIKIELLISIWVLEKVNTESK